jgi:TPR repeat protein
MAAPCDVCQGADENRSDAENHVVSLCFQCGCLLCGSCHVNQMTSFAASCPRCEQRLWCGSDTVHKLRKLIAENPHDPRLAQWIKLLGGLFHFFKSEATPDGEPWEQNVVKHYKWAAKLGLTEAYRRLAEFYCEKKDWNKAIRFLGMAADLHDAVASYDMGKVAYSGCIDHEQEPKGEPDFEEAFRRFHAGAKLGYTECFAELGTCYMNGQGTEKNLVKGFKWSIRAAEQGQPEGMRLVGECYSRGEGVEQSIEQAIYWFEKSLELEDDEYIKEHLESLQSLNMTSIN